MKCPNCNSEVLENSKFCNNCGYNFENPQDQTQQAQPQYQPMYQQPVQIPMYQQPLQQPTKKKPKWWQIAIAVILVLLLFKACFGGDSSDNDSTVSNSSVGNSSVAQRNPNEIQDKGELGSYEIEIVSARLTKDYDKKDVIVVTYKFTNNSDDDASFMYSTDDKAFQDGIELDEVIVVGDLYNFKNASKDIKPGKTITVEQGYYLNDKTTPVDVEVSKWISLSDKKIVKTFDLSE